MSGKADSLSGQGDRPASGILVTGGTGFLGSHVAAGLLRRRYSVYLLARPRNGIPAQERVRRLFDWLGVERPLRRRLRVLEGDLDLPGLGLDGFDLRTLKESAGEMIHCASSTSFLESRRRESEKSNVENLSRIFDVLEGSRCRFFHLVSTAYVAGKRTGPCPEEFVETARFHNVYEETKYRAERLAADRCEKAGMRLNVFRPSIVYGDSRTGRTLRFDALYYPVRTVFFFRNLFERDIREHQGEKANALGISIDRDGRLLLPMRVKSTDGTGVNLIPVDHFVDAFLSILENAREGGIYHIVNPRPATFAELTGYTSDFLRVRGIELAAPETIDGAPRNGLELLFDRYLEAYSPYMNDARIFSNFRAGGILRRHGVSCPAFDYRIFRMCMQYAVDCGWGSKLPI